MFIFNYLKKIINNLVINLKISCAETNLLNAIERIGEEEMIASIRLPSKWEFVANYFDQKRKEANDQWKEEISKLRSKLI